MRFASALIGFGNLRATLASRPASPGTIDPSRNRSPPVELCFGDLSYGLSIATGQILPRGKAGAARLIPGRRRKSAGPFGIRRHLCALLLRQHLELDHVLDRVLPILLQSLGTAEDGEDQPAETHERQQPSEEIKARYTAQDGDQHERDRRDQLEVERRPLPYARMSRGQRVDQPRTGARGRTLRSALPGHSAAGLLTSLGSYQWLVGGMYAERPGRGRDLTTRP